MPSSSITTLATGALWAAGALAAPASSSGSVINKGAGEFTFWNIPPAVSGPCDLTTGPDGAIWGDTFLSNKIFRIDPNSGALAQYNIPYTLAPLPANPAASDLLGRLSLACVVQPGKDGKLYAAAGVRNEFVVVDPKTNNVTVYPTGNPLGNLQPFNDAWPGETGMYFSQTTANLITLFDYQTHKMKSWTVPTPLSSPVGIIVTYDHAVWFCEFLGQKIGRLNATTGEIREYPVPPSLLGPAVMRATTDRHYIWFTAIGGNALGRVDIRTGEITAFPNDSLLALPIEDTNDGAGNVWFSTLTQNYLNYLTPSTGQFTHIQTPDTLIGAPLSLPVAGDIAMHWHEQDNSMWFTELIYGRVGRFQLTGQEGK